MKFEILYPGAFSTLLVNLEHGEAIKAESGAMITMSETLDVESRLEKGVLGGLTRKLLTGESLFFQTLLASRGPGEAMLASAYPGEIAILELDGSEEYVLQKDGFLAAEESVEISTKAQNWRRVYFRVKAFL
jgi:uncharacterized protein (AIM24 family)